MVPPTPSPATPHDRKAPALLQLEELATALEVEIENVEQLCDALLRQRAAVAADQTEAVNASVDDIGRILLALGEARRRRAGIVTTLTGDGEMALEQVGQVLGLPLPAALEQARLRLRRAAGDVIREAAINRGVLHRAIESGEAFLHQLFSATMDPPPVYGPPEHGSEAGNTGVLLNRRA